MRDFDGDRIRGSLAAAIMEARRVRSRAVSARDRELGGQVAELPMPGDRAPLLARVTAGGERRQRIMLLIPDIAYIELNVETGTMAMQAKAKALWAHGWETWASTFLGLGSWWAGGELHDVRGAQAAGWRVTGIELCSDFVDLPWYLRDVSRFITPGRSTQSLRSAFRRGGSSGDGVADTIEIGKRSSNVSWVLYRKTTQILQAKGGDASTYESTWRDGGWDGEAEITRTEIRFTGRALTLVDRGTDDEPGGEVYDFRDPATLCEHAHLARLWATHTYSYWLPVDDGRTRSTRSRCDPRWQHVRDAAKIPEVRLDQMRAVQVATWDEAKARTCKQALRALQRLLALHGHKATGPPGYATAAIMAILSMRETMPDIDAVLAEYAQKYAQEREPFLGREIWERGAPALDGCHARDALELIQRPTTRSIWRKAGDA